MGFTRNHVLCSCFLMNSKGLLRDTRGRTRVALRRKHHYQTFPPLNAKNQIEFPFEYHSKRIYERPKISVSVRFFFLKKKSFGELGLFSTPSRPEGNGEINIASVEKSDTQSGRWSRVRIAQTCIQGHQSIQRTGFCSFRHGISKNVLVSLWACPVALSFIWSPTITAFHRISAGRNGSVGGEHEREESSANSKTLNTHENR